MVVVANIWLSLAAKRIFFPEKWRYGLFHSLIKMFKLSFSSRAFICDTILNQTRQIVTEGKFSLAFDQKLIPHAFARCIQSFIIGNFRRDFQFPVTLNLCFQIVKTSDNFSQIKQSAKTKIKPSFFLLMISGIFMSKLRRMVSNYKEFFKLPTK